MTKKYAFISVFPEIFVPFSQSGIVKKATDSRLIQIKSFNPRDFLSNKEIVTYKNIKDLAKKIIKFSKNNKLRKKIAKNGREKYHKFFNSKIIADYILKKTFNISIEKKFAI